MAENTKAIRSLDWDRDRFDIEFSLDIGTTYNSYLIFGADKTALVDASHEKFRSTYLPVLKEQLKAAGRSIDYLIVSHTEPDHSGQSTQPCLLCIKLRSIRTRHQICCPGLSRTSLLQHEGAALQKQVLMHALLLQA